MYSEQELIERACEGNVMAFESLINQYKHAVFNYCYRMCGNREDAEDLSQEVFVKVYRSIRSFQGQSKFTTWLYQIASRTAIDYDRKRKSQRRGGNYTIVPLYGGEEDETELPIADTTPGPDEQLLREEMKEAIQFCISRLSPHLRSAIILRHLKQFTYEEVAASLQLPLNTIKTHVRRGRMALKDCMEIRA